MVSSFSLAFLAKDGMSQRARAPDPELRGKEARPRFLRTHAPLPTPPHPPPRCIRWISCSLSEWADWIDRFSPRHPTPPCTTSTGRPSHHSSRIYGNLQSSPRPPPPTHPPDHLPRLLNAWREGEDARCVVRSVSDYFVRFKDSGNLQCTTGLQGPFVTLLEFHRGEELRPGAKQWQLNSSIF